jgi:hypothetical protein
MPWGHSKGGWMDQGTGLNDVERRQLLLLPKVEIRPLGRTARSKLLYRLRYRGSSMHEPTASEADEEAYMPLASVGSANSTDEDACPLCQNSNYEGGKV